MTAARAWLWATILLTAGALVSAVALAPPPGASPVRALSWLLFTGSSVHVASTGWLFTVPAVRAYAREHTLRCRWIPVSLVVIAAVAAAAIRPGAFGWLLLPYFGWQFFHYQKQNLGMASLAASAQGVRPLRPAERRPLLLAGICAIAALAARPGLLGLRLAPPAPALFPLAAAAYAVAIAAGLAALARRPASRASGGLLRRLPDLPALLAARVRLLLSVRRGRRNDGRTRTAVPAPCRAGRGRQRRQPRAERGRPGWSGCPCWPTSRSSAGPR